MPRRHMDFYETSAEAVDALVKHYLGATFKKEALILEPCCGDGAIVRALKSYGYEDIITNDLDCTREAHAHYDASTARFGFGRKPNVVVTNPPFNKAFPILLNLHAQEMSVAMLLRLTFLEPTKERGEWLAAHPPTQLIVLPRYSFTGDGKTDRVTCAWMVWDRFDDRHGVVIVPRKECE